MKTVGENIVRSGAVVLASAFAYAGCSASNEPERKSTPSFVEMQTEFDYAEHEPYAKAGKNGIRGRAFVTRSGDVVVTCAGNRVLLLPATSYFREMFWHMIVAGSEPNPPAKPHPGLKRMIRRAECDAQGRFSFSDVPDGTWFVLTQVSAEGGGLLITETTVRNGVTPQILLTDKHIVGQ